MTKSMLYAIVASEQTIQQAIHEIHRVSGDGGEAGIAVVVDSSKKVLGVITDGDIRWALCENISLDRPVMDVASEDFCSVYSHLNKDEQLRMAMTQLRDNPKRMEIRLMKVVVVDREQSFVRFTNLFDLYRFGEQYHKTIAVYGMGFVGLTLALTLAEKSEMPVIGIDINSDVIRSLSQGTTLFYEKGLNSLLDFCLEKKRIQFVASEDGVPADIHILSVGTPVTADKQIDFSFIDRAIENIARVLKHGDMVILRSTVPTRTTRDRCLKALEEKTNLKGGTDFYLVFAPERTIEGNALSELKTLPQIIGGLTSDCVMRASSLFQRITPSVVKVDSLEIAEVIKLINNTYRDTVFGFANEVALLCEQFNANAFDVIKAANDGYPRNPIPMPSPGVGGLCLDKDPHLYQISKGTEFGFGRISRQINEEMVTSIAQKFVNFTKTLMTPTRKAFILGVAFKGYPETSDIRFSTALSLKDLLVKSGFEVHGFDYVATSDDIEKSGIKFLQPPENFSAYDGCFVMNNNPNHIKLNIYKRLRTQDKPFFFFDGWNIYDKEDIESIQGITYASLGYQSKAYGH